MPTIRKLKFLTQYYIDLLEYSTINLISMNAVCLKIMKEKAFKLV